MQRAGLRLTTINWHLTADEAGYIVDDCEAKAFVADARFADAAAGAAALAPAAEVAARRRRRRSTASSVGRRARRPRTTATSTTRRSAARCSTRRARPAGRRACCARGDGADGDVGRYCVQLRPGDRTSHLCTGPLYHAAPLAFSLSVPAARWACGIVLMDGWDAEETLRLIERAPRHAHAHGARRCSTGCCRCPTTCGPSTTCRRSGFIIHGAAPCPVDVKQAADRVARPDRVGVLRGDRGLGQLVDAARVAGQAGHRRQGRARPTTCASSTTTASRSRAGEVGTVYLKAPARPVASSTTRRPEKTARRLPRRLLHARRHRLRRRGRLPVPHRPQRQPHHHRRREHLPGRGRGRAARPSGGGRCRRRSASPTTSGAKRSRRSSS